MSAGAFTKSRYGAGFVGEFYIVTQPETLLLTIGGAANTPPAGPIAAGARAVTVSGSRRRRGVFSRMVRIKFTGAPPAGYEPGSVIGLPLVNQAIYDAATEGAAGSYLGNPIVVVGASPERRR